MSRGGDGHQAHRDQLQTPLPPPPRGTHPLGGLLAALERHVLFADVFGQLVLGAAQEDALAAGEAVSRLVERHVLQQRLLAGELLLTHAAGGAQLQLRSRRAGRLLLLLLRRRRRRRVLLLLLLRLLLLRLLLLQWLLRRRRRRLLILLLRLL